MLEWLVINPSVIIHQMLECRSLLKHYITLINGVWLSEESWCESDSIVDFRHVEQIEF
jgi:hypothetical protein